MPKIIDHDVYRLELVAQAIPLFAERGYAGIGMRDIANALGVSKSALYHYFPSKDALFDAVVAAVVQADAAALAAVEPDEPTLRGRLAALLRFCADQEAWFGQQFLVLADYVRGKSAETIRTSPLPAAADAYCTAIGRYLQIDNPLLVRGVLICINGLLLQRLLDGGTTDFDAMATWLETILT